MWRRIALTPASRQLCLFLCAGRACGGTLGLGFWCAMVRKVVPRPLRLRKQKRSEPIGVLVSTAVVVRSVMMDRALAVRGAWGGSPGPNGLAGCVFGEGRRGGNECPWIGAMSWRWMESE